MRRVYGNIIPAQQQSILEEMDRYVTGTRFGMAQRIDCGALYRLNGTFIAAIPRARTCEIEFALLENNDNLRTEAVESIDRIVQDVCGSLEGDRDVA